MTQRLWKGTYWLAAPALALWLYWPGLRAGFQKDDFAWLALLHSVGSWPDLLRALFQPTEAQGSWRPLGERAYYLGLHGLFGPWALPFRVVAFLTQFVSLTLVTALVKRISGSRAAGLLAAVLWMVFDKLMTVMVWSAEYMLILCGLCLLGALCLFVKHADTGEKRYLRWCWVVFLAGFGAIETNVVFPLLAAGYAALFARRYLRKTVPMFLASVVFAVLHMLLARPRVSTYSIHFDATLLATFWQYWRWVFEPVNDLHLGWRLVWLVPWFSLIMMAATAAYAAWQARRGRWAPVWYLAWFVITLLPVLPARGHVCDYYLTLPVLGFAMLGADALVRASAAGWRWRLVAFALSACFVAEQAPSARIGVEWWRARTQRLEAWVQTVRQARQLYPRKMLLLVGVNDEVFWEAMAHGALGVFHVENVYLAPGSAAAITRRPEMARVEEFELPVSRVHQELAQGSLEVLAVRPPKLVRMTQTYQPPAEAAWRFDVAIPDQADRIGEGWYEPEQDHRWMSRRAVVFLPGPTRAGQQLVLSGKCPPELLAKGPVRIAVRVDGQVLRSAELRTLVDRFRVVIPLPGSTVGKERIEVAVEVDRTFKVLPDIRELSLVFGTFEIE